MSEIKKKILLITGGTGGHIFPAITLSNILKSNGYSVLIVGDDQLNKYENSIECEFKIIKSGKTKSLKTVFSLIEGFFQSISIIKKFKPDLIIGFGSYATFPLLCAGKFLKVPFYLHESNSIIGKVNKWMSPYAKCIMTNFQELYGINIKNANKISVVGMPIRESIIEASKREYKYPDFSNDEKFNIFITGGSGGATFFSNQILQAIELLDKNIKKKICVYHQARIADIDKVKEFYVKYSIKNEVKIFFDDMNKKYKNANLVIARSGTGTISEITTVCIPTIFIPSPNVANNHQAKNVEVLKKANACIVQEEKDFNVEEFSHILKDLIENKNNILFNLIDNMKKFSNCKANDNILECINKFFDK